MPGSDGAVRNSRSVKLYFVDCPTVTLDRPFCDGGVPADDVPQYWHRAAGFMPMFIAHAESRHRVRFALEHFDGVAMVSNAHNPTKNTVRIRFVDFISLPSITEQYIKKTYLLQNIFF